MKRWLQPRWTEVALIVIGLSLTVALRTYLLEFKSADFFDYTKVWYTTLKAEGFSAFGRAFSNYNLPYLYALYVVVRAFPDIPPVIAIKIPSLIADYISAFMVYRIVSKGSLPNLFPLAAAFCVLIAPTLVLNSAFWGQADAVYASMVLTFLYALLGRRDHTAMVFLGIALALKIQTVFIGPLVAALILRGQIRGRTLIWIPAASAILLLPAWIAGRPLSDLLWIYPSQALQYEQLTLHAPSALAWIPDTGRFFPFFNSAGLALGAAAALAFTYVVFRSKPQLRPGLLIELAWLSATLLPFCLPRMHERYFYMADILSIPLAFLVPPLYFVPIAMITISFMAYQPALFGVEPVSMSILAICLLVLLVAVSAHALRALEPGAGNLERPGPQ